MHSPVWLAGFLCVWCCAAAAAAMPCCLKADSDREWWERSLRECELAQRGASDVADHNAVVDHISYCAAIPTPFALRTSESDSESEYDSALTVSVSVGGRRPAAGAQAPAA